MPPAPRRESLLTAAGLGAVILLYGVRCGAFWHQINDDAFITFRYSAFLALGRGPYFNSGEHVEGYTNFLLMLLLAPVYGFGGEAAVPVVAKVLGVACGAGSLVLVWMLVRRILVGDPDLARIASAIGVGAAALVVASPAYAVNSTTGLATTMFGFWLALGVVRTLLAQECGAWRGAGFAFAAAALTRPEGVYVFAAVWSAWVAGVLAASVSRGRAHRLAALRPACIDAAIVVAAVAAHFAFRVLAYDGEWLPNTYYAKAGGFWKIDAWHYIHRGMLAPFFGAIGVALAIPGAVIAVRRRRAAGVLFAAAIAGTSLPFITGTDWMLGWRLLMPYLPLVAAAVAIGWAVGVARVLPRARIAAPVVLMAAALALAAMQAPLHRKFQTVTSTRATGYAEGHAALAQWLCREGNADPGDTIALMDVGIVGYRCTDQRILDISGLTDRFIAKNTGSFLKKDYDPAYIVAQEPRFVVLTLTAAGWWYQPPPVDTRFHFWTPVERRLYQDPEFQARYVHRRDPDPGSEETWQNRLARRRGAVRIFEHAYPEAYYLLLVFDAEGAEVAGGASR